jgi:hypothetical protein
VATDPTFEQGIQVLIDRAREQRQEVRERYERQLQQALSGIDEKIEHYRCTLNDYLAASGVNSDLPATAPDAALVKEMRGASYRQKIKIWADAHGNRVVMKDLINFITEAGLVKKRMEAHRSIYSAMTFAMGKGDYEKIKPGLYQSRSDLRSPRTTYMLDAVDVEGET